MTHDALILIGREGTQERETLRTHAERLRRRHVADTVRVMTYVEEPLVELRDRFRDVEADRTFVLPAFVAHSHETTDAIPDALRHLSGDVRYCEPIGRSPALTDLLLERAADPVETAEGTTLVLVGLGSSSQPYHRQTANYHAARLRERSAYADVLTCYLFQNPAVECVRYNVRTDRAVAVPLFMTRNETTAERIPEKLELDRGGIEYAAPFGDHPLITDAIHGEVTRQRALTNVGDGLSSSIDGSQSARHEQPLATDGDGQYR